MPPAALLLNKPDVPAELQTKECKALLCINQEAEESEALQAILKDLNWPVRSATTCAEAVPLVQPDLLAIFCEAVLTDGTWQDILKRTGAGAGAPPLIVTSRRADACLWSEVLNLGGYDVLVTPFAPAEVAHVLANLALRSVPGRKYAVADGRI